MLNDLHDDETLDAHDKARAADMDERPIYSVTINVTVQVVQAAQVAKKEPDHDGEEEI
jgi:hypothetical protein